MTQNEKLVVGGVVRLSAEYDEWYQRKVAIGAVSFGDTGGKWKVRKLNEDGTITLAQRGAVRPCIPRRFISKV